MAVKTEFYENDILIILQKYDIGTLISFNPITEGSVQTNFKLITSTGEYVLRYYENRTYEQVLFEIDLLKKLKADNFPCANPIFPKQKNLLTYNGKPYVIFEFVSGEHIDNKNTKQEIALIETIGKLGKLTANVQIKNFEQRLNYNIETLIKLAKSISEDIGDDNAKGKLDWLKKESEKIELPSEMTMGICHCDYYYSNIIYDGDIIKAIIDFDDANYTYLFFDIVSVINFFTAKFNHENWDDFDKDSEILDFMQAGEYLEIFEQVLAIPQLDKYHLYDILKLGILFDTLWYFDRGEYNDFYEKRKIDSLNKMGRDEFYRGIANKLKEK